MRRRAGCLRGTPRDLLMVDAYCLQYPDRYRASAKSFAAHLTGLCWLLEPGGSRAIGADTPRSGLDSARSARSV